MGLNWWARKWLLKFWKVFDWHWVVSLTCAPCDGWCFPSGKLRIQMVNTWRLHHPERVRIRKVPLPGEVFIGLLDIFRISVSSSHLEGTLRRFSWAQLQCFDLGINWWLSNYFTHNPIRLLESASWTTNRSAFARCYGHENRLFRTKATDLRAGTQCCGHWGELNLS